MRSLTLRGGRWWDGRGFRAETVHCAGGLFARRKPAGPAQEIDLTGGFVIPPFGDAHCHHFDNPETVSALVAGYLREGVFYAQNTGNSATGRRDPRVTLRVNRPDSVDVVWADASLTGTLGHPFLVYEALANGLYNPGQGGIAEKVRGSRKAEGDAYAFADDPAMLARVWPRYEKRRPDFLKVILSDCERHEEAFARQIPGGHGLDPALLPAVVERAHRAGLRVWAHVDTAFDFRVGVLAGVDGFAHMPGYGMGKQDARLFEIAEADARAAGRRGVYVTPTAAIARNYAPDADALSRVREVQRRNLRLLKRYGVRFAVGMDSYGTDARPEAEYLSQLGVFTPAEMLNLWCEQTAQAIFPGRRIGRLADGYEASFLVLRRNPLEDFARTREITHRVKQGVVLESNP